MVNVLFRSYLMNKSSVAMAVLALISSASVFAAPVEHDYASNTQIQVDGSKGGNYGFTLTMQDSDVMYYDATSKEFISQKVNGVMGLVSLKMDPATSKDFVLKAKLDNNPPNGYANKLHPVGNNYVGATLAPIVAGVELTDVDQEIDLASWVGHDLVDASGEYQDIEKEPVYVNIKQTGVFGSGVATGEDLPVGQYTGHADIEWTAHMSDTAP